MKQDRVRSNKVSGSVVIGRMVQLLESFPSAGSSLPAASRTKSYWRRLFSRNERTARLLAVLMELPLFIRMRKSNPVRMDWIALLERDFVVGEGMSGQRRRLSSPVKPGDVPDDFCPDQVKGIFQSAMVAALDLPSSPRTRYWRDHFGPSEVIQRIRPEESKAYLPNPHRGTTTFQRFQGDELYSTWKWSDADGPTTFKPDVPVRDNEQFIPRTTLSYCRWPWRWFEPAKGSYNWGLLDQALKTAKARGQTLQIRFEPFTRAIDYSSEPITAKRHPPEMSVDMPDWYWDTGAAWIEKGPYDRHEPDFNDPRYFKHFGAFIRAAGRRFDGHPDLESVDIAVAGKWGESGGNATPTTKASLVKLFRRSFTKTPLLAMLGGRAAYSKEDIMGFRVDCFGDLRKRYGMGVPPERCWNHTFDVYPMVIANPAMVESWKTAPVTMETCWTVASWYMDGYDLDVNIREGYNYHTSIFMPKSVFFPSAWMDKLIEFDKKIGYRYAIRQITLPLECKTGGEVTVKGFIDNVGCAPIYRPYRLALRFRQGANSRVIHLKPDIRTWLPGHNCFEDTVMLPRGMKKGEVKVDLVIVDDADKPKVWFAMDAKTADGWHPLASMDVV